MKYIGLIYELKLGRGVLYHRFGGEEWTKGVFICQKNDSNRVLILDREYGSVKETWKSLIKMDYDAPAMQGDIVEVYSHGEWIKKEFIADIGTSVIAYDQPHSCMWYKKWRYYNPESIPLEELIDLLNKKIY